MSLVAAVPAPALIAVDDNGIGIDPQQADRIWRMFERVKPRHAYPGNGLGLTIVARAAARMGGIVGASGCDGGGSTFWIDLRRPA